MGRTANNIYTFFTSIHEVGLDARGYTNDAESFITYNKQKRSFNKIDLNEHNQYDYFCGESNYQLLNDSIVECIQNNTTKEQLYAWETVYTFYKINSDGSIHPLESDRHFDFTKFVYINESYFKGCFGTYIDGYDYENDEKGNVWVRDHLTINDLDMMRNEIFADYGYKFQSEKWQKHFSKFEWYKSSYENVDEQLTDMDRHNIKVILKVRKLMLGKEDDYTNLRREMYVAAG